MEAEKRQEEQEVQELQQVQEAQQQEELEKLKEELEKHKEKLAKLENTARLVNQRFMELQKEYEYLKERYRRDLEEHKKYCYEKLALELLNVLDDFERAFESIPKDESSYLQGFEIIYRSLKNILENYGVREMQVEGSVFDPYLCEAVDKDYNPDVPPNTVIKVVRKGYYLHDKVLRPARVIVSVPEEEVT
ncbi:nucleotide exchange factor GrpE [Thermocrinis minervae]|nr:nucleotide exchange factor GrpE [Thermocrinis minervae]